MILTLKLERAICWFVLRFDVASLEKRTDIYVALRGSRW